MASSEGLQDSSERPRTPPLSSDARVCPNHLLLIENCGMTLVEC